MKVLLFIAQILLLASCTAFPITKAQPNPVNGPHAVVKAMYTALNAKDLDGAMQLFADDAVYIIQRRPFIDIKMGKVQIRAWLAQDMNNGILNEFSDLARSANNLTVLYKRIQDAEVVSQEHQTFVVQNGKITGVGIDPESVIRYAFSAMNDKKINVALAFFTDNAVCMIRPGKLSVGKEAIRSAIQQLIDSGAVFETHITGEEGFYEVVWELKIYDRTGKMISDSHKTSFLQDGKIVICEREE
jgi:ketosteroid isomerase-like protein